jgi:hypothetical protein
LEPLFDPLFLLPRARFAAVDADCDFEADFFADFLLEDFLLEDFEAVRCLRAFSDSICSPSVSRSSSLKAASAF